MKTSMKQAGLGVAMHSGWGVLVAVAGEAAALEVVERRRIVVMDTRVPGAKQPYHHAASLLEKESAKSPPQHLDPPLAVAESYLANCAAASERLAEAAIGEVVREIEARGYRVAGCVVLMGAGRPLPALEKILAAHPLIHTAEGEFFRHAVRQACERLEIPVTAIRERDLEERAKAVFGRAASQVQRRIESMRRVIGPPWTKDHKGAALGAGMVVGVGKSGNTLRKTQKNGKVQLLGAGVRSVRAVPNRE
jgi:hypothetical protein